MHRFIARDIFFMILKFIIEIFELSIQYKDYVKNCHSKLHQSDNSSYEESWGDNS